MRRILLAVALLAAAPAVEAKIMVFGGEDHDVYLGCLSCGQYESDSIHNQYGTHGSRYSSDSIHNRHGEYGSAYSSLSACSRYATDPPVIVDHKGGFYGYLTMNRSHPKRTRARETLAWLAGVCSN